MGSWWDLLHMSNSLQTSTNCKVQRLSVWFHRNLLWRAARYGPGGRTGVGLPEWAWAAAAAAVYQGSKCISSSLCLLHTGLGLRLASGPSLSPPLALDRGLTLCWLSLHLSPSVRTEAVVSRPQPEIREGETHNHTPST